MALPTWAATVLTLSCLPGVLGVYGVNHTCSIRRYVCVCAPRYQFQSCSNYKVQQPYFPNATANHLFIVLQP